MIISMVIGIGYQCALTTNQEFKDYLINSHSVRASLIDYNKEGIFSMFGYLTIYFAGESVCYRIKHILNEK
jgi:hypothetical protein